MENTNLSEDKLKLYFDYNENTGEFIRKIKVNNSTKIGDIAGHLDKDNGYVYIRVRGKKYRAHHLVWLYCFGYLPKEIDHINGIRNDNRIENLREVDRQENCKNQKLRFNNKSGKMGVHFCNRKKRWVAQISYNGKPKYLGSFINISDAIRARKLAEIKYGYHKNHGRVAN